MREKPREMARRLCQYEDLLRDLLHFIGRLQPTTTWQYHEIDAYRDRIQKTLMPRRVDSSNSEVRCSGNTPVDEREPPPGGDRMNRRESNERI